MHKTRFLKQIIILVMTVALAALPLLVIFYLLGSKRFFGTFTYVFSGDLFAGSWNRIHADSALDQPTIGKWYFWFTVFTITSLPYMLTVKIICVYRSKIRHWIFSIGLTALCVFLICLLTIPFFWLIQYINAMGVTSQRILGLLYGLGGYAVVLLFYAWAVRPRKEKDESKSCNPV